MYLIVENHAYDHRRLTLVRYETLALTKPEYKLTMMTSLGPGGSTTRMTSVSEVEEYIVPLQVWHNNASIILSNIIITIFLCLGLSKLIFSK